MSKILIVYGSETGNTESIAEAISKGLQVKGHEVDCKSAGNVSAANMAEGYDAVLMGASAWGIDDLELQSDFAELAESFDEMGLGGKLCGAFASGDTSYEYYCGAVDFIESKAEECGAKIVGVGLKIEGDASDGKSEIEAFVASVDKALA